MACPFMWLFLMLFHRQSCNNTVLLVKPVCKFFGAGFPGSDHFFSLQGFFFEGFKCMVYFFQPFRWKFVRLFCFVDLIPPVLAFILVKQVIIIFPCPFVKLAFVLQSLCFSAFFTAQFIPLAFCKEKAAACGVAVPVFPYHKIAFPYAESCILPDRIAFLVLLTEKAARRFLKIRLFPPVDVQRFAQRGKAEPVQTL